MKIIQIKSSNIKKLKVVELTLDPNKNLIMVTGKNTAGKSSLLDSIWYALGGKNSIPSAPVRKGEEKGEVTIDLEGYIVTRTFTDKGSYLKVTNKEGHDYSNPQEFLNFIVGNLSFDPLLFSKLEAKKRVEELRKISGLDFTALEEDKKKLSDERTLIGREVKTPLEYSDEQRESIKNFSAMTEVSVAELSKEIMNHNAAADKFEDACNEIEQNNKEMQALETKIMTLKKRNEELTEIKKPAGDQAELNKQLDTAEATNQKIRDSKASMFAIEKYERLNKEHAALTEQIKAIDEDKKKQLSEVKMPIDGLSFDENEVLFNGIPYNQLSSAEQLRVSMAIAMASNPKLKVVLIKDGSLLDCDNLKVIEEMAKEKDWQVWIEKVDDSGKVGIVIENGEVKTINE